MTQAIDHAKLKEAAEHLEWVLSQYPESEDVQSLMRSLAPLIDAAKEGKVSTPMNRKDVPGAWSFGDGRYIPYKNPSVDDAYVEFSVELRGGRSEQDQQRILRMDALRKAMKSPQA